MLMRFDPFRELDNVSEALRRRGSSPTMPMDAYRDGERFVVHFDLPGVDPDSIDLTVEKNVLSVQADRDRPRIAGGRETGRRAEAACAVAQQHLHRAEFWSATARSRCPSPFRSPIATENA
jgi:HSP20 family molecular chaperone IbpA